MKYPFGVIKDGRVKDIISIIVFGFPIICYRIYSFPTKVAFLWIVGFHIFTKQVEK